MEIQKGELAEAKRFIESELDRLVDWSLGDIKKCCRMNVYGTCSPDGALIGSFILWVSAIDYFGGIYTNCPAQGETERRFREFITKYMPQYDYAKLVELRWALLHYYSTRHFAFHQNNDIDLCKRVHLSTSSHGIVLDLFCAINDLENAISKYKNDLASNDEIKVRLLRYFKTTIPLVPIKISYIRENELPRKNIHYSNNSAGTAPFPS